MTRIRRSTFALVAFALLAPAACGGSESAEEAVVEDVEVAAPEPEVAVEEVVVEASPEDLAKTAARKAGTDEALAILKETSDFLTAQASFGFEAEFAFDVVQSSGHELEFGGTRSVRLRRPDRLRVESQRRDGERATLTFDGESISIDLPDDEAYVQLAKPGDLDQAIDYLVEDAGVPAPLDDFLNSDLYSGVAPHVRAGLYVGDDLLDGRWCRRVAFDAEGGDVQLWVEEGERPLPCRVVITYKQEEGRPQFRASFRSWDLAAETPDDLFAFAPAEGAERIPLATALAEAGDDTEVTP